MWFIFLSSQHSSSTSHGVSLNNVYFKMVFIFNVFFSLSRIIPFQLTHFFLICHVQIFVLIIDFYCNVIDLYYFQVHSVAIWYVYMLENGGHRQLS